MQYTRSLFLRLWTCWDKGKLERISDLYLSKFWWSQIHRLGGRLTSYVKKYDHNHQRTIWTLYSKIEPSTIQTYITLQHLAIVEHSWQFFRDYQRTGYIDSLRNHRQLPRTVRNSVKALGENVTLAETLHRNTSDDSALPLARTQNYHIPLVHNVPVHRNEEKAHVFAMHLQEISTLFPEDHHSRYHPINCVNFASPHL